jgi:hypothetical protein
MKLRTKKKRETRISRWAHREWKRLRGDHRIATIRAGFGREQLQTQIVAFGSSVVISPDRFTLEELQSGALGVVLPVTHVRLDREPS